MAQVPAAHVSTNQVMIPVAAADHAGWPPMSRVTTCSRSHNPGWLVLLSLLSSSGENTPGLARPFSNVNWGAWFGGLISDIENAASRPVFSHEESYAETTRRELRVTPDCGSRQARFWLH
jgi:hypothetical protein